MDPRHADVNVHPQKLEVKFDDERHVYAMVGAVVKKGLTSYSLIPGVSFSGGDANGNVIFSGIGSDAEMRLVQGGKFEPMGEFRVNAVTGGNFPAVPCRQCEYTIRSGTR